MRQALQVLIAEMEYVLSCINEDKIPFDGDDFHEALRLGKKALAQPEQKYHRGNRLLCLETEEYCVIHISGTDRQWVKFPDSHIGIYTNEQVAELFELLPKETEQEPVALNEYDAGLLNDYGGGNVEWWQDYIRAELGRAYEHYQSQITTPPQRTWVGLTDDEIAELWYDFRDRDMGYAVRFAHVLEAKLKEKNT